MKDKTLIFTAKVSGFFFAFGVVYGSLVPAMVSQKNSAVVMLGIMCCIAGAIATVKYGKELLTESKDIFKGKL